jgi:hypothetical protein
VAALSVATILFGYFPEGCMQDKYAGDVGDFGKFILLKAVLKNGPPLCRLGVNWYNVNGQNERNNDGRHTHYLTATGTKADAFRSCDPALYDTLRNVVLRGKRSIATLERAGVLPRSTLYYNRTTPTGCGNRKLWFQSSLESLAGADALFLDPDNGLAPETVESHSSRAIKYTLPEEIRTYFSRFPLLIVYNHRDRSPEAQYRLKFEEMRKTMRGTMRILRFQRVSVRDYLFLYHREAEPWVQKTFADLTHTAYLFREY